MVKTVMGSFMKRKVDEAQEISDIALELKKLFTKLYKGQEMDAEVERELQRLGKKLDTKVKIFFK